MPCIIFVFVRLRLLRSILLVINSYASNSPLFSYYGMKCVGLGCGLVVKLMGDILVKLRHQDFTVFKITMDFHSCLNKLGSLYLPLLNTSYSDGFMAPHPRNNAPASLYLRYVVLR